MLVNFSAVHFWFIQSVCSVFGLSIVYSTLVLIICMMNVLFLWNFEYINLLFDSLQKRLHRGFQRWEKNSINDKNPLHCCHHWITATASALQLTPFDADTLMLSLFVSIFKLVHINKLSQIVTAVRDGPNSYKPPPRLQFQFNG